MFGWVRRGTKKSAEPRLELTPAARAKLAEVLGRQPGQAVLRILVRNPGGAPPQYDMALEAASAVRDIDAVVVIDGLRVVVDPASLSAVDGASVDFRDDPLQPGFLIEPPRIEVPSSFDDADPLAAQVEAVLQHDVNPAIAAHGGHAHLLGVKDDVVFVALGGGCQGCSMASVTLKQGIEQIIKQAIPRIRAVVDATDHALGSNPFYTADKGGETPFHQPSKA